MERNWKRRTNLEDAKAKTKGLLRLGAHGSIFENSYCIHVVDELVLMRVAEMVTVTDQRVPLQNLVFTRRLKRLRRYIAY